MPNVLFDIPNPLSNTLILDDARKGRVQFTVNNIGGRPLARVAGRLTPAPDAAAAYGKWLKLEPDGFRAFKIADSLQYTANIDVPATGDAGTYAFRLDVWDDANPDDTLVNGPSITFAVPAHAVKPPTPFPWWIPVVAVAVIILIVGAVLITRPAPTPAITPLPVIIDFSGHWLMGGGSFLPNATADLNQNGIKVNGTFLTGRTTGTISGTLSGNTLSGEYQFPEILHGRFTWSLTSDGKQFQGSGNATFDWCGWRVGGSQPVPCRK